MAPERGMLIHHTAAAPVCALMKRSHPLAKQRTVTVAEAVRYPLAVGTPGMTGRQLFDMACSQRGLVYEASVVSNFSSALLPLLRDEDIVLTGAVTAAHLLARRGLVLLRFRETQMRQRRLHLMSLEGRTRSSWVQALTGLVTDAIRRTETR